MCDNHHTVVFRYDTGKGYAYDSVGFESRAKTKRGLIRAADNAAFWRVNALYEEHERVSPDTLPPNYRGECDIVSIDGNAI